MNHTLASPAASTQPPPTRRERAAWALYDFANSGYTTVVITAIYNAFFVGVIAGKAPWATFAWSGALAISYVLSFATAPAIGAYADAHARKKVLLLVATVGCVVSTALLALTGPGGLVLAIVLVVISNFFFSMGENLAAAFLPELASGDQLGRLSGWSWAFGYIGGLISLGTCLAYVIAAQARGEPATAFVPVTMLITATIFAVAALPTFFILRERAIPRARGGAVDGALERLTRTWREASRFGDLKRFLIALVFIQAGVQTVVALAAVYAEQVIGFTTQETITLILVVNVAAAVGAFIFGSVQDRFGHVPTILTTIAGWIATIAIAWFATDRPTFWVAATTAGLCLGASQSAGRALVGYLAPPGREGEFFGLWGLSMKLGQALGPLTYGAVTWASQGEHRLAMLTTGLFFVIGAMFTRGVDAARGRANAHRSP